jgi:diguanylate cyclase (GGDEF)-like protein
LDEDRARTEGEALVFHLPQPAVTEPRLTELSDAIEEALQALSAGAPTTAHSSESLERLARGAGRLAERLRAHLGAIEPTAQAPPVESSAKPRVLFVDDDQSALAAYAESLGDEFEVLRSSDPFEALEWVRKDPPAAVVTDFRMPGMNGQALLGRLAEEGAGIIPSIVVSAARENRVKLAAFDAGAFDYLTKPVDPKELSLRLHHVLQQAEQMRRERRLQETDELTGLPNRRALHVFLARPRHYDDALPVALAMLDMDELKPINDSHGHRAGDGALKLIAEALTLSKRAGDCAARVGGDEFVLAMPGADIAGAAVVLARFEAYLAKTPLLVVGGTELFVKVSAGLALWAAGESRDTALQRADAALYEIKRGRHLAKPWVP